MRFLNKLIVEDFSLRISKNDDSHLKIMEGEKIDSFLDSCQSLKNSSERRRVIMTSVETFKSAVIRIRDILRAPGVSITGMDSMRHICLYLLSRYMTREMAKSLKIPEVFSWENLIEEVSSRDSGVQKAFDLFYHPHEECLVIYFDGLFGTKKFSFDIKDIHFHAEILQILDRVNMYEVDSQMDILGWVYEQHLKTGSSTAGRDLGQYFTNRQICEYMTQLCQPGFKEPGVPETVLDPTMGTGGFLTSYIKFYKKNYPPVDWAIHSDKIHGYDSDTKVAALAQMNLFMEMNGHRASNLKCQDSLYKDIDQTGYDIILANMPFGLKGLKHEKCCDRIKSLKIKGNVSEPLFLQLMMASLNHGGRCAVVVPDGMLVNNSKIHKGTRQMLLNQFDLKRVIKMKGKFFTNTSIEPSILLFEKTGTPTQKIEFWEVTENESSELVEKMILSLPREELNSDFSFDVRKYQKENITSSSEYQGFKLDDLLHKIGSGNTNSTSISNTGEFPFYGCTNVVPSGTHSSYDFDGENYFLFAKSGGNKKNPISPTMGIGKFHHVSGKSAGNIAIYQFVIKPEFEGKVSYEFLKYFLAFNLPKIQSFANYTTGNGNINVPEMLNSLMIIIPPRPIQDEIVATLDRFYQPGTEIADTLKLTNRAMDLVLMKPDGSTLEPIIEIQRLIKNSNQNIERIKEQMISIMKGIDFRGFDKKEICEVMKVVGGRGNNDRSKDYAVPYYDSNGIAGRVREALYNGEYTITARKLSIGSVHYVNGSFHPSDNTINFTSKDISIINNQFFYYWLLLNNDILKRMSKGIKPGIRKREVEKLMMPVPPMDFQMLILQKLLRMEAHIQAQQVFQEDLKENSKFMIESYLSSSGVQENLQSLGNDECLSEEDYSSDSSSQVSKQEIYERSLSKTPTPNIKIVN